MPGLGSGSGRTTGQPPGLGPEQEPVSMRRRMRGSALAWAPEQAGQAQGSPGAARPVRALAGWRRRARY